MSLTKSIQFTTEHHRQYQELQAKFKDQLPSLVLLGAIKLWAFLPPSFLSIPASDLMGVCVLLASQLYYRDHYMVVGNLAESMSSTTHNFFACKSYLKKLRLQVAAYLDYQLIAPLADADLETAVFNQTSWSSYCPASSRPSIINVQSAMTPFRKGEYATLHKSLLKTAEGKIIRAVEKRDKGWRQLDEKTSVEDRSAFFREVAYLRLLQGYPSIPTLYHVKSHSLFLTPRDHHLYGLPPQKPVTILPWLRSIARLLARVHPQGVAHLDLTTGNLVVNDNQPESLLVIDWGLAHTNQPNQKVFHFVTQYYNRAPELWQDNCWDATAADIWSFGCIMAELLLGHPLFWQQIEEHSDSQRHPDHRINDYSWFVRLKHLFRVHETLLTTVLTPTLLWCLQIKPADRPTAAQVLRQLEEIQL